LIYAVIRAASTRPAASVRRASRTGLEHDSPRVLGVGYFFIRGLLAVER
jgi:hypothetical protein